MKKQSGPKRLQLNRETLSNLEIQNTSAGGLLSWYYDCDWKGVSKGFSNCNFCDSINLNVCI